MTLRAIGRTPSGAAPYDVVAGESLRRHAGHETRRFRDG
jgi:hypothetical protein